MQAYQFILETQYGMVNDIVVTVSPEKAVDMFLKTRVEYLPKNILNFNVIKSEDSTTLEIIYLSNRVKKLMHIKIISYLIQDGLYLECA